MSKTAGRMRAILGLDKRQFDAGLKGAQSRVERFSRAMRGVGRRLSIATAAATGAMTLAVRSSLNTIDAQAKMAESLDTSVVSLQNLDRAAELAGISQGELEGSLLRMTRRISLAEKGTGPAVKALDRLNLSAAELNGLPVDERVNRINQAIRDMIPEAQRAGISSEIFGDRTGLAMQRLQPGVIAQATEEIRQFGVGVSDLDADQVERTNDAMSSLSLVTKGLANRLTVALAPVLETIAKTIANVAARFSNMSPQAQKFVGIAGALALALGPLAIGLGFAAAGLAVLASPLGLVILGFGAVAAAAIYVASRWDELKARYPALAEAAERVGNALSAGWDGIKEVAKATFDAISSAVEGVVKLFEGDFSGAMESFKSSWGSVKEAVSAAVDGILNVIDALFPGFRQAIDDIIAAVKALPAQLLEWGGAAIQSFVDGMTEKWAQLKEQVKAIFRFEDAGATAIEDGKKLGEDKAVGMANGMRSQRASGEQEMRDYIEAVEGAGREAAESNSPSKLFMRLGADLMSGLGLGIQANTQIATDAIREGVAGMSNSLDGLGDKSAQVADRFAVMVAGIIEGTQSIGDVLKQLGSSLLNTGLSGLFNASGIGNIFSGLFPGFEGGGFTGMGARSGGIDGRGGFPAILHPNETVIDHTRGMRVAPRGAQAMNVTITMDESTGAIGAFVRDEAGRVVAQAAPKIVQQSVGATYRRAREHPIGRR